MNAFDRIETACVACGEPAIRDTGVTIRRLIEALALCPNWNELHADYPQLDREDVRQALDFFALRT